MRVDKDQAALLYLQTSVLQPNEKVAWKGRPNPFTGASIGTFKSLFGVFFFGFAVFWTVGASQAGAFALFGIPFLLVGAWMVSAPLRNYLHARRTYYAITDKRVLILTVGSSHTVNSIVPEQITDFERTDRGDGSGNIKLRTTVSQTRRGSSSSVEFTDGLWGVADVKGAADAITALRTSA